MGSPKSKSLLYVSPFAPDARVFCGADFLNGTDKVSRVEMEAVAAEDQALPELILSGRGCLVVFQHHVVPVHLAARNPLPSTKISPSPRVPGGYFRVPACWA